MGPISERLSQSLAHMREQIETGLRVSDYYPQVETVMGEDLLPHEVTVMVAIRTPDALDYQADDWRGHRDTLSQSIDLIQGA